MSTRTKKNKGNNKKLSTKEQRLAWIAKGLCGIDGKHPIWQGHSKAECRTHFLYYKAKAGEYAKAKEKKTKMKPSTKDMIAAVARSVASSTMGDAHVAFPPDMTRKEMFNHIHKGVEHGMRVVGFQP